MGGYVWCAVVHFPNKIYYYKFCDKLALKSIKSKTQYKLMIEGVLIQDIDATDYYRRFVLLKMMLKKAMEDSLLEET